MRLKKLELYGFKSFAEKVSLDFDVDIIALVGPNGCGKSNIVDAFLWVLGEQSAKSLRAEKMQDVLFAGADELKAFNVAEVSLTFSDANSAFGDEITISRRVYRDGETQYLINKKEVRLKDIHDLFLGTGIGKNGLFVFEQGRIDEIINMTPEKRRAIFEETAGISRFLQKKKESLTKLVEVDQNYFRLKDLHKEVEKRFHTLQNQAKLAQGYNEQKATLETLERKILSYKIQSANVEIQSLLGKQVDAGQKAAHAEEMLITYEKTQKELRNKEEEFDLEKGEVEQKYAHAKTSIKLIDVELKTTNESLSHLVVREKRIFLDQEKLEHKQKEKGTQKEEKQKEIGVFEQEKKEIEQDKKSKEAAQEALENTISHHFQEEKKLQKLFLGEVQKEGELSTKVNQFELKIETLSVSSQAVEAKLTERKGAVKLLDEKIEKKKEEVATLIGVVEKDKQAIQAHEKKGLKIAYAIEDGNKEKEKVTSALMGVVSREKVLLQLQEEMSFFSNGTATLLKEAKQKNSPLYGKVEELYKHLAIDEGKEIKHLSFYEETLLVKDRRDLEEVLDFAFKKKVGDFSVLLHEDLKEFKATFLSKSQDLKTALHSLHKQKGNEIFTDQGIHINRYGVLFYRGQEKSIFSKLNEIKQLKKEKSDLEKQKKVAEEELGEHLSLKKEWESSRLSLEEARQKKEMALLQENFFLQRLFEDRKETQSQIERLEKEKNEGFLLLKDFKLQIKQASQDLVEAKKRKEALQKQLDDLEKKIKEKRVLATQKNEEINEIKRCLDKAVALLQKGKEALRLLEFQESEEKKEEKRLLKEVEEIAKLKRNYEEKKEKLQHESEAFSKEKDKWEVRLKQFDDIIVLDKEQKRDIEAKLILNKKELKELEKEKHRIDLLLTEKKTFMTTLLEKCQFDWQKEEVGSDFFLEEAEKKAYTFRFELENATPISFSAIEECKEEEKRFTELDKQLSDITMAKEDLEKIIAKLEKESRRLLKSTFEQVRAHFQKNFKVLFNGGEADLSFTDGENILEAGVEILGRPPGKKMRSLSLLSGGEKCLTTLALLFALFEVRPAPFCILDEVDAPLDEANVGRFTALLKEFVSKTQFIVVTHNKKTMAVADSLVGVSMEKRGVSKLVTLGFG